MFAKIPSLLSILLLSITVSLMLPSANVSGNAANVKIAVLAHRGHSEILNMWSPTASYLAEKIPGYSFEIIPLDSEAISAAVKNGTIDFVAASQSVYDYKDYGELSLTAILEEYRLLFVLAFGGLSLIGAAAAYAISLRKKLNRSGIELGKAHAEIDAAYDKLKTQTIERQHAGEALKRSNEFMRSVLDSISDAIAVIDIHDFSIVAANNIFLEELGMREEYVIGEPCHGIIHRCHEACMLPEGVCPLAEIVKTGKLSKAEHAYHARNGEKIVEVSASSIRDENGDITRIVRVSKDITERKEAELDLIKSHQDLKQIANEIELANTYIDRERRKLQSALDEISSLTQQVATQKNFGVRFENPNLKKCYEAMNCGNTDCCCYGREPARCWQVAGTYCNRDKVCSLLEKYGNCTHCTVFKDATSTPIYTIGEHFNNMMHILNNQHQELEKAYSDLKTAHAQIFQQEKMASIGQLAAGVAHEINNPMGFIMSNLNSLSGYLDKLSQYIQVQSDAISDLLPQREHSDIISETLRGARQSLKIDFIMDDVGNLIMESLDGAERIKRIVQNLKSFSRVDEFEWKMADINAGLESTINIVWNELKYKAEVKKEYGDIPAIKCNPGQLNQVFMNMLINAAQAIEKQGEITVRTWHENGHINISISDTGCGIPEDKLNRIFEPFYTTKEVGKGTGLGLSIAYDIVKKHRGKIKIESKVSRGSVFTVKIPVDNN